MKYLAFLFLFSLTGPSSFAAPIKFTLMQNTLFKQITVTLENCKASSPGQDPTCNYNLGNLVDGSIRTVTCNGLHIQGNKKQSCQLEGNLRSSTITIAVGNIIGSCIINDGDTLLIRSLCDGQLVGSGDFCPGMNNPNSNTFTCTKMG